MNRRIRALAFYLPQFYPTPENDGWWGKGFTEWTNVAKAKPLFPGHYQPHIPADLGFYDLRVPETRAAQAEMAQQHGIEGFCYWHYWFQGRRLLERPFDSVLSTGEPAFPFCLAWANHTWSRSWLGDNKQVLLEQTYSPDDDVNHIRWLIPAFADSRYIKVGNRPLFLIYNPYALPDARRTIDVFRTQCVKNGLPEPFLIGLSHASPDTDPRTLGFDGALTFQIHFGMLKMSSDDSFRKLRFLNNLRFSILDGKSKIYYYDKAIEMMKREYEYPSYTCVATGWDNTPRRGEKAVAFVDNTPEKFEHQLSKVAEGVRHLPPQERLVFINAWNEWGEGMHLEPDLRYGKSYLDAVSRVVFAS